ncbi:MAG TPA: MoaD/ThiS family protein [Thermoplasmata archaeon]|nr:MoaD/ThiS family protein [Thermoplasmata archaeon]
MDVHRPPASATVRVRLFATARTAVGTSRLDWPVPPEGIAARDLVRALGQEYPALRRLLDACRFFLDGEPLSGMGERVRPGHEFTIHPPYGGG